MIGKTISHYKILEKIGEGGMGVVYLAEDTKLDRKVALKFLPKEFTKDKDSRERFEREAKAAAALNHPNIVTIHEINEFEGQTYIAMEYVEGQTLKEIITRVGAGLASARATAGVARTGHFTPGPLPIAEALNITTQICEGLKCAHQAGIVHRDIKPQNIIIDKEGRVKILDFGLAKLKGVTQLTKESSTLGTVHYISPEQAKGIEVDYKTDIWSLGLVLYEMVTGQLPFKGDYDQAVIYSILNEEPPSPKFSGNDIPDNMIQIINKCLKKDPSERLGNMNEIIDLLKISEEGMAKPAEQEKSIIVLPFENMSPDPDQEYFSDGLTEEVITDLSHINELLVISRNSAMTFKGTNKKTREIAKEVRVQYVLEGSVRKAGNNLRITAQLIDANTDTHRWAEKYSGTLDDVFEIQEKVSRSIVDALKIKLSPVEDKQIAEHPIDDIQAYEYYKKAYSECFKMTDESINQALRYLNSALEITGDNAYIYSGLAWSYWWLVNIGVKHDEGIKLAEDNIKKALELNPDLSIPHALSGFINMGFKGKTKLASRDFKIAITKNPEEPIALTGIVVLYVTIIGHIHLATPYLEKLEKIDPLDFSTGASKGATYFYNGVFDKALTEWSKLYKLYPDVPYSWLYYALGLAYNNKVDEVIKLVDIKVKTLPDHILSKILLMLKYALINDTEKLNQILTPELITTCKRDGSYGHHLAGVFAIANEKDQALDWLENAINAGFINYPMLSEKDIFLENIRGEERFKKLMKRVKHEWENFEV